MPAGHSPGWMASNGAGETEDAQLLAGRHPEVIHVSESANRRSDLGEAAGLLGEKAGWHFQAARAPHDDISTESTVLPWSGQAGRRDSGASAGFFAFFT